MFSNKLNPNSQSALAATLLNYIGRSKFLPIILCIGTDKVTGDCLGPLVGHKLKTIYNLPTFVYGSLFHPVTANNLQDTLDFIKTIHPRHKIIAVDASLGKKEAIGIIRINKGGLFPGSALGKNLGKVGNIAITAVVGELTSPSQIMINGVSLNLVNHLADNISIIINRALNVQRSFISLFDSKQRYSLLKA